MNEINATQNQNPSVNELSKKFEAVEELLMRSGHRPNDATLSIGSAPHQVALAEVESGRGQGQKNAGPKYYQFDVRFTTERNTIDFLKQIRKRFPDVFRCEATKVSETQELCAVKVILRARSKSEENVNLAVEICRLANEANGDAWAASARTYAQARKVGREPEPKVAIRVKPYVKPKNPHRLTMRCEFLHDVLLARIVLAPYVVTWLEKPLPEGGQGPGRFKETPGADRVVHFEVCESAPNMEHLRWLLDELEDMHVAAQSLDYEERYTGDRMHYEFMEELEPPPAIARQIHKCVSEAVLYVTDQLERLPEWLRETEAMH